MHLGMLGPRRVHLADDGGAVPPPYQLTNNEYSLLDDTDLVFIDPVSTGFSRAIPAKEAKKFHDLREDTASVAEFIRIYITRNKRWDSPKFVIGESYGTTRAAALSGELSDHLHINVNGIMLVSTVLNFQTISFGPGNDLAYVLFLPSYTSTAWFHKKLPADLQQMPMPEVFAKAQEFAAGPYSAALFSGSSLTPAERQQMVADYARFTGLSTNYVDRANLRVSLTASPRNSWPARTAWSAVTTAATRDMSATIGRRHGTGPQSLKRWPGFSPRRSTTTSATELKYKSDLPYEILTRSFRGTGTKQRLR